MAERDNEHVELHEVRGFASDDLIGAFHEVDAIARGTRCQNYLFSMSLNPPEDADVSTDVFEQAADEIERKLGLDDQPRAIVFHEKDGRRHAHIVWSRIDTEQMRAINMSHYKSKLRDVSRKLYLKHGWDMPRGLEDKRLRDPLNFSREEWQQARRTGLDPRELKAVIQKAWAASDNMASLEQALRERGFWLARGDKRGFVTIDYRGEVYSLARYAGVKTKDLEDRLGDRDRLRPAEEIKAEIAQRMTRKLKELIKDVEKDAQRRLATIDLRKAEMIARHQDERARLWAALEKRWEAETHQRAERLPKGVSGIWHRLTGRYAKVKAQNEQETLQAYRRDQAEKDALIFKQLEQRQSLQRDIRQQRAIAREELMQLREDVARRLASR
nr:relaxase/mobilization nuclease domain-containing protein [Aliiruegeria lutimaris]